MEFRNRLIGHLSPTFVVFFATSSELSHGGWRPVRVAPRPGPNESDETLSAISVRGFQPAEARACSLQNPVQRLHICIEVQQQ